jgi:hypothetical protein
MMRPMQLDRSRTALQQATDAVEELRAAKNQPELFRDRFVSAMGMVQRVGAIIDHETQGHRTPQFGDWWKQTQSEPLYILMRDVRNAEYKRGESRQAARPSAAPPIPHTVDWFFSGGGLYDGQEVLSIVDRYLTWAAGGRPSDGRAAHEVGGPLPAMTSGACYGRSSLASRASLRSTSLGEDAGSECPKSFRAATTKARIAARMVLASCGSLSRNAER